MSKPTVSSGPKSGWGSIKPAVPCSLSDVMSEELARKLQTEDNEVEVKSWTSVAENPPESGAGAFEAPAVGDTDSDLLMAQMLQHEYDKEADLRLNKVESQYNGNSKVAVSFAHFRQVHPAQQGEAYSDEEDDLEEAQFNRPQANFGKRGMRSRGSAITTKHDPILSGRANASRSVDQFPMEVDLGDCESFDMKLPNRVYNNLRNHSMAEAKRAARLHEKKDHSSATQAIDPKTKLLLFKLVGGMLRDVNGVISSGKESVVLHAHGGEMEDREIPAECAIKVFKTTLAGFKNRETYVRGDFRFSKDPFKKQSSRKVMKIWAEKETLNLRYMRKFGITCPEVVWLKQHILIMSFVGKDMVAAPQLKTANLSPEQLEDAYAQCVDNMKKMYSKCGLVHGDLSEYNMLWHNGQVWFIDVSQACELSNPNANTFLLRDCFNVTSFFKKQDVHDVPSEYQLFNDVTGLNLQGEGSEFLQQIQEYEKKEIFISLDQQRKDFAFDYLFSKSAGEKEACGEDEESDSEGDSEEAAESEDEAYQDNHATQSSSSIETAACT